MLIFFWMDIKIDYKRRKTLREMMLGSPQTFPACVANYRVVGFNLDSITTNDDRVCDGKPTWPGQDQNEYIGPT